MSTSIESENKNNSEPEVSFTTELCNRFGDWWTVCKFYKKVAVSLSGLCGTSIVDKLFYLLEPDTRDRYGTFVGMTGWLIEFDKSANNWKIHHKGYIGSLSDFSLGIMQGQFAELLMILGTDMQALFVVKLNM